MRFKLERVSAEYGAQMGRKNILPENRTKIVKLYLEKMDMVDEDYDNGGCYWGGGTEDKMYVAYDFAENITLFIRGRNRREAKEEVINHLPNAKFFR